METPEQARLNELLKRIVADPKVGSVADLAEMLEPRMTPQGVYKWVYDGRIPIERAIQIERITEGRFTRDQLCPWAYL